MSLNCSLTEELLRYFDKERFLPCFSNSSLASSTTLLSFSSVSRCAMGFLDSAFSIVRSGGKMASRHSNRRLDFRRFCTTLFFAVRTPPTSWMMTKTSDMTSQVNPPKAPARSPCCIPDSVCGVFEGAR